MIDNNDLILEGKRVINEEINALQEVCSRLDNRFAEAVKQIISSKNLITTGVGKSGIVAKKIAATLTSIGTPAFFLHPVEALHGDIGIVSEEDTILMLSKSGSTDELVRLVPFIKSRNAKIISIVCNMKSFLAEHSDIVLDATIQKEACPLNLVPTSSTTVSLAIGDAIASSIMKFKEITTIDFSRQHPLGQLGRNITLRVKDIMHANSNLPITCVGTAFRDAIIEMTNKGLGCICVVDSENYLKGIITDGDLRRVLQKDVDISRLIVDDLMTHEPIAVGMYKYLGEALALMENRTSQISVLPVVDEIGKCVGVIRLHDIVRSGL